jgi:hypothetical protein
MSGVTTATSAGGLILILVSFMREMTAGFTAHYTRKGKTMSRPLGSACCDNEVTLISNPGELDRFTCNECHEVCEVVE